VVARAPKSISVDSEKKNNFCCGWINFIKGMFSLNARTDQPTQQDDSYAPVQENV
jgi:hypothetical protein